MNWFWNFVFFQEKLIAMRRNVSFMRILTSNELGFSLEGDQASDLIHDLNSFSNRQRSQLMASHKKQHHPRPSLSASLLLKTKTIGYGSFIFKWEKKTKRIQEKYKYIYIRQAEENDSRLLPPEGEDAEYDDDILTEVKELAEQAAKRLKETNKNGRVKHLD